MLRTSWWRCGANIVCNKRLAAAEAISAAVGGLSSLEAWLDPVEERAESLERWEGRIDVDANGKVCAAWRCEGEREFWWRLGICIGFRDLRIFVKNGATRASLKCYSPALGTNNPGVTLCLPIDRPRTFEGSFSIKTRDPSTLLLTGMIYEGYVKFGLESEVEDV